MHPMSSLLTPSQVDRLIADCRLTLLKDKWTIHARAKVSHEQRRMVESSPMQIRRRLYDLGKVAKQRPRPTSKPRTIIPNHPPPAPPPAPPAAPVAPPPARVFIPGPLTLVRDTLQDRIRPGEQRMSAALDWLDHNRMNGHHPLADWNGERLAVVNQHGQALAHPAGLLPELLFLLRDKAPYKPPVQPSAPVPQPAPGGAA